MSGYFIKAFDDGFFRKARIWLNTKRSLWDAVGQGGLSYKVGHPEDAIDGDMWHFERRKALAPAAKKLCQGIGSCYACELPWSIVKEHTTYYGSGAGCFPLCQMCWEMLNPNQRLPFYERLFMEWERQGCDRDENVWNSIKDAVLENK